MTRDDMAAKLVADPQRALEVHPPAGRPGGAAGAMLVRDTVSAETSTSNQAPPSAGPRSTTVRQTPSQAIEAPSAMPSGA